MQNSSPTWLRKPFEDGSLNLFPGTAARINQVKMIHSRKFQQVHVFHFLPPSPLLSCDVITAECRRDHIVGSAVNQPLTGLRDGELHRIGFAIMIRHFGRSASKKLSHRVVAEVELIGALQVYHSGEGNHRAHSGFVCGETERQLASGGVSHNHYSFRIELVLLRILDNKLVSGADVGEGTGPCAAIISDAAIFEIRSRKPLRGQRRAKMARVIKVVFCAPESSVDVDDERVGFRPTGRQSQVDELIWVRSVVDP